MKSYDNNDNYKERTHTIRVTLQSEEYKGHIAFKMGGNCFGLDLLEWNPECCDQEEIEKYIENDCEFKISDYFEGFEFELKNDAGETCKFECDEDDLKRNVVAIEIIDCKVSKEEQN